MRSEENRISAPPNLSRRSFLFSAAVLIPSLRVSGKAVRRIISQAPAQASSQTSAGDAFAAIEHRMGGRLGVTALDTQNGRRIVHRANERFPMCSTFKFLLVAGILSRVDRGQENLSRFVHYTKYDLLDYAPITKAHVNEDGMTVSDLCAAAIEYSDNTAANLLLAALGGPAQVTQYARSLGDSVTRLDRTEPELNSAIPGDPRDTTSPSAMLEDMQKLLLETRALSAHSREQLESWLIADATGRHMLRAGLPPNWRIGDKTGSGKNGSTNDIAICRPPDRAPILITAYFTGSHASYDDTYAAIAEVGRIVAREFS